MNYKNSNNTSPLVSVMMPTYNRADYLGQSLQSALNQDYSNFEVIVIRDGGADISGIVNKFADGRIKFINRDYNKGKPYSLNEGLQIAGGKYICYLDDDDIYYPHHIKTLVDVLEDGENYQAAYSDLYKAHCKVEPDGHRRVIAKNVEVSRDFDRFFVLHFNLALHVSLMHRRDLLDKTGLYNENLKIMIDWDFNRRAAFFADFKHIHTITGQFYGPVGECDRISVQQRKNKSDYIKNILAIKTSRPTKPWSKVKDLSIIFILTDFREQDSQTLTDMWLNTFYPYQIYMPLNHNEYHRLNTEMPVAKKVAVANGLTFEGKIDAVLEHCQSEYTAIVYSKMPIKECWVERGIRYFEDYCGKANEVIELEGAPAESAAVLARTSMLVEARKQFGHLGISRSIEAAGGIIRKFESIPYCFEFDSWLATAKDMHKEKKWIDAANLYARMGQNLGNVLWMNMMCAFSLYNGGEYEKALKIIKTVNLERPTVSTMLLEGRILDKLGDYRQAIEILNTADEIIEERTKVWIH